jgi:hypothetical protein
MSSTFCLTAEAMEAGQLQVGGALKAEAERDAAHARTAPPATPHAALSASMRGIVGELAASCRCQLCCWPQGHWLRDCCLLHPPARRTCCHLCCCCCSCFPFTPGVRPAGSQQQAARAARAPDAGCQAVVCPQKGEFALSSPGVLPRRGQSRGGRGPVGPINVLNISVSIERVHDA